MKRVRKVGRFLVLLCLSAFGVGLAALWVTYWLAARDYDRQLERAKSLGLTYSYDSLVPDPPLAEAENAAPLYGAAIVTLEAHGPDDESIRVIRDSLRTGPQNREALRKAVADWEPYLPAFQRGAALEHCRFEREWSEGVMLSFPEFPPLRQAAEALCGRALLQARDHAVPDAVESLRLAVAIGRHCGEEPVMIGSLVQLAVQARVLSVANLVVDLCGTPAIQPVQGLLATMGQGPDLAYALRGEVAFQFNVFSSLDDLEAEQSDSDAVFLPPMLLVKPLFVSSSLVQRAYEARTLKRWCDAFESQAKIADPIALSAALDLAGVELERSHHPADLLAKILFPVFTHAGEAFVRLEANKRLLAASLDLRMMHAFEASYPDTPPVLPKDPFDGQPLRYRREGDGFLLYSVGGDREDDGGREKAGLANGQTGTDLALHVPALRGRDTCATSEPGVLLRSTPG